MEEEIRLEKECMLKSLFPLMKSWYQQESVQEVLMDRFGNFPMFWQDLENWEHMTLLKKLYLMDTEGSGNSLRALLDSLLVESASTTTFGGVDEGKKKKRRWGAPKDEEDNTPIEPPAQIQKPKGRWGAPVSDTSDQVEPAKASTRTSRWSTATATEVNPSPSISEIQNFVRNSIINNTALNGSVLSSGMINVGIVNNTTQLTQEQLQQTLVMKMRLQQINEKLLTVAEDAAKIEADPNRSPSPPPKYDAMGKRTNTREFRMKEQYMKDRSSIIDEMLKLNPNYNPPSDFIKQKPVRRIPIPATTSVDHNYIGLIIGPRGSTQKELEQKTGCKISVRGKGSLKEGSRGRVNKIAMDEDEELHVHVTGDNEANVEMAVNLIQELLRPDCSEEVTEHKQKQLRTLALYNGTLVEDEYCPVCGEKGHRQFECPHRAKTFQAAGVKCSICGDSSHPTRDCPLKQQTDNTNSSLLDSEYDSFMAALGDKPKQQVAEKPKEVETISFTESRCVPIHHTRLPKIAPPPSAPSIPAPPLVSYNPSAPTYGRNGMAATTVPTMTAGSYLNPYGVPTYPMAQHMPYMGVNHMMMGSQFLPNQYSPAPVAAPVSYHSPSLPVQPPPPLPMQPPPPASNSSVPPPWLS